MTLLARISPKRLAIPKILKHTLIRNDGRIERFCEHGVGHTIGHINPARLASRHEWIHGCCHKEVDGKTYFCCAFFPYMDEHGKVVIPTPKPIEEEIEGYNKGRL